jgi:ribosomal protein S18 acetylase RimI-like enzyme
MSGALSSTMTDAVTIRRARPDDMLAVGRLGALLVRTHYEFDQQRFLAPTAGTARGYGSYLASLLDDAKIVILVAEGSAEVVGYSYAGLEGTDYMALRGPAGAIYDILVDPPHRRQGIGRKLLDATVDELRKLGAPRVVLSTAERNEEAQRLFESAGFRRTMIEMTRELDD